MHLANILRVAASTLLLCATLVTANLKTPTFTKVFDGTLVRAANLGNESGPFGLRQLVSFGGGNLTDPTTGKVVANFIPGVGGGLYLLGTNGEFYPDVRAVAQFVEDSTLAYFDIRGVRDNVTAATHAYLETDSPKYKHLSAEFLFFGVNVTTNPFIIAIYRLDNGKHHGHW